MEPFRYHVFACDQQKPDGAPCCSARGSTRTIDALRREIASAGLSDQVQLTVCGSLGLCERGPNLVVYPGGIWYSGVGPEDVPEIVRRHFTNGQVVDRLMSGDAPALAAEILTNRNRMLAARSAKEESGALPDELNQTIRGYQESRVILTAIELDVFSGLGGGSGAEHVAKRIGTDARATEMLLNALVALGLATKEGSIFRAAPLASRFFVEGAVHDARAATMHHESLWRRWSTLTDAVRAGTAVRHETLSERGDEWTAAFIAAMHRNASERARLVVQAVGTAGVSRMLDLGGGSGAYSIAFAQASESLRAEVFDLDTVLPITRGHIDRAGVADRVTTRAGDLRRDSFGGGYDLVLASQICHMLTPPENLDLFRRCHEALAPGGRIVIQEFILDSAKTSPKHAVLFSLNMLVGTEGGASYSEEDLTAGLREAGFDDAKRMRLPGPTGLVVGTRL